MILLHSLSIAVLLCLQVGILLSDSIESENPSHEKAASPDSAPAATPKVALGNVDLKAKQEPEPETIISVAAIETPSGKTDLITAMTSSSEPDEQGCAPASTRDEDESETEDDAVPVRDIETALASLTSSTEGSSINQRPNHSSFYRIASFVCRSFRSIQREVSGCISNMRQFLRILLRASPFGEANTIAMISAFILLVSTAQTISDIETHTSTLCSALTQPAEHVVVIQRVSVASIMILFRILLLLRAFYRQ